jgi:hypothetical protein
MILPKDMDEEIEKLKMMKVEIANKMNLTTDYDEREEMRESMDRIQRQIEVLERVKSK